MGIINSDSNSLLQILHSLNTALSDIERTRSSIQLKYRQLGSNWNDKKYYLVPDVTNMSLKEAQEALEHFQIEYSGKGENIVEQSPKAGERILEGEKVRLLLTD